MKILYLNYFLCTIHIIISLCCFMKYFLLLLLVFIFEHGFLFKWSFNYYSLLWSLLFYMLYNLCWSNYISCCWILYSYDYCCLIDMLLIAFCILTLLQKSHKLIFFLLFKFLWFHCCYRYHFILYHNNVLFDAYSMNMVLLKMILFIVYFQI